MAKFKDRTGIRYGRLTVIKMAENMKPGYWLCKCDCGNEIIKPSNSLGKGRTKSCGCLYKETRRKTTHGMTGTRIYKTWQNMKSRCNNPKSSKYYLYGGKGIKVCEDWNNNFLSFYNWAINNGYKDDLTIDRINPDRDYEPTNCKWATYKEQNSHLSGQTAEAFKEKLIEYKGETHNITQWANKLNINYKTLLARYERGWSIERMLETPKIKEKKRGDDGRWESN